MNCAAYFTSYELLHDPMFRHFDNCDMWRTHVDGWTHCHDVCRVCDIASRSKFAQW